MSEMTFPAGLRLSFDHAGLRYCAVTVERLRADGVPDAAILAAYQADLCAAVDAQAESLRARLITPGIGQAMEYQEAQAQAFSALGGLPAAATPERYPMLAASIGIDRDPETGDPAADVLGVARSVTASYRLWLAAGAAIREARLRGKAGITAAATPEAATAAAAGIAWPPLG